MTEREHTVVQNKNLILLLRVFVAYVAAGAVDAVQILGEPPMWLLELGLVLSASSLSRQSRQLAVKTPSCPQVPRVKNTGGVISSVARN